MSNLRRNDGMTLIEVMITLGIASIMMIGILQIVNLSQRSTRNVTINADWNNFVSNVKLSMTLEENCMAYLGGGHNYKWDQLKGIMSASAIDGTMDKIDRPNPPGSNIVLVGNGTNYKSFTVNGISLLPQTNLAPVRKPMTYSDGITYLFNSYQANLSLTATKNTMEPHSLGGANLSMTIPIPLSIVTGPESMANGTAIPQTGPIGKTGVIYSCHAESTDRQAVCDAMGGIYITDPPPHCYFPYFSNFAAKTGAGTPAGVAGELVGSTYAGARLQLFSQSGGYQNPQASDYVIGYGPQQMWFNIGGNPTASTFGAPNKGPPINSFVWSFTQDGTSTTAQLMALDREGVLVLNPRWDTSSATLAFGAGVSGGLPSRPQQKIGSNLGYQDLEFSTSGKPRMVIRSDGTIVVGPTPLVGIAANSIIAFADYQPGFGLKGSLDLTKAASIQSDTTKGDLTLRAMSPNVPPALTDAVQDRLVLGKDGTNNIFGALIVKKLADPQQYAVLDGSTSSIYGSLTLGQPGATGTVPYGCHRQDMDVGPMPSGHAKVTATCPAGEILLGGGGNCNIAGGIDYYMSINGPAFVSQQWWVKCESVDPAKAASLQSYVYAFCCKH